MHLILHRLLLHKQIKPQKNHDENEAQQKDVSKTPSLFNPEVPQV